MQDLGQKFDTSLIIHNHFDGVVAYVHLYFKKISNSRSPATSETGTASEISLKSSSVSFTDRDPMLLSRFLTLVVPAVINDKALSQLD